MASKGNWIKKAIKHPGALKKKASAAGKSVAQYCKSKNLNTTTKRQCNLANTLSGLRKKKKK